MLNATDGGSSTLKYVSRITAAQSPSHVRTLTRAALHRRRSPFNDQVNNSKLWGPLYDGRSIVSEIHERFLSGGTVEECQAALKQVSPAEEAAKLINTWA